MDRKHARRRFEPLQVPASEGQDSEPPGADSGDELMTDPDGRPETREERVERLRALIASGAYNPSPEDVARAMIEKGF